MKYFLCPYCHKWDETESVAGHFNKCTHFPGDKKPLNFTLEKLIERVRGLGGVLQSDDKPTTEKD